MLLPFSDRTPMLAARDATASAVSWLEMACLRLAALLATYAATAAGDGLSAQLPDASSWIGSAKLVVREVAYR